MCGIVGAFGADRDKASRLRDAARAIAHRGPDDEGFWECPRGEAVLAHRRLSIIDLSPEGHQPMVSPDGRYVMVFNGEIYNYRELRQELQARGEQFRGHSDSEVLLRLFALEGTRCFTRLNGIFAAAFWDRETHTACLVRDPIGVKPMYFAHTGGALFFASEIKALLRAGWLKPELNPTAVIRHLGLLWSPGEETIVQGVSKLLPGQLLTWRLGAGEPRLEKYTDLRFAPKYDGLSVEDATTQVADAVRLAVRRQLVADVPVGAFLSGGLDSSSIVAFARQELGTRMPCFSIAVRTKDGKDEGFEDDLPYARRVAKHLDVDLHVVQAGVDIMDRLPDAIHHLDEPTADPAAIHTLLISELARANGMKVLLSGAGGDDIFTGYRRHVAIAHEHLWNWLPGGVRRSLRNGSQWMPKHHPLARRAAKLFEYTDLQGHERIASYFLWLGPQRCHALLSPALRAIVSPQDVLSRLVRTLDAAPHIEDPLDRMLLLELRHFLADHNLNYADKMGMAAGVEIRVPLLDPDLVDLACRLPVALKQRGRTGKWIFKKAMEPYLPHDVIYRPKTGFGVPLRKWMAGPLNELMSDTLGRDSVNKRGIFDAAEIERLRSDDAQGVTDSSYTLFALACMELWCRQNLDGVSASTEPAAPMELAAS